MRMHNPPHPGEIIKALCLEPLGLTINGLVFRPEEVSDARPHIQDLTNRDFLGGFAIWIIRQVFPKLVIE